MTNTTSSRLRPALSLLLLFFVFLVKFSWTTAIPTDKNNNNASINTTEVADAANITERSHLDNVSSEKFAHFKDHFKDDYIEPSPAHFTDSDEEELCYSERKLIYPKTAMTKDSEQLTIAQFAEHKQGVFVEQCVDGGRKCKYDDAFPLGLTSSCVQRFNFRAMVVLVNGELKEELIKLPSSCKCVLKRRNKI